MMNPKKLKPRYIIIKMGKLKIKRKFYTIGGNIK